MPDITYLCKDCKQSFVFSEGEQDYYRDRGLAIPKRCAKCRLSRRQGRQSFSIPESTPVTKPVEKPQVEKPKEPKE